MQTVDLDRTRQDIRHAFSLWDIDPSEFEILWEENRAGWQRPPGAKIRYMRNGKWQEIACYDFNTRAANLRQCYLLLDRLRIAEQQGVQYQGLTFTKELTATAPGGAERKQKEDILDAYDILGASPDDPIDLIKSIYQKKAMYYHPDKGGDQEKFKRLDSAYNLILQSRRAPK